MIAIAVVVAVGFERWQRRPEFNLAIFKLKPIDSAKSSGQITRKRIMKSFANWPAAEPYRNQNSARCLKSGNAALELARIARQRSSWLMCKVCTSGCYPIAARARAPSQSSEGLGT